MPTITKTKKPATKIKKTDKKTVAKAEPIIPASATIAVIATGGKQYIVKVGTVLLVESLKDKKKIELSDLLYGRKVTADIEGPFKGEKLTIRKFRPKSRYSRTQGHRQQLSRITITAIK